MGHDKHADRGRRPDGTSTPSCSKPAYDGAKFDVSGHCIKHPNIRLCKPTKAGNGDDTATKQKYVIVRKTCHLCGEHGVRNERKFNKRYWSHGYELAKMEPRKATPKGLVGTEVHASPRATYKGKRSCHVKNSPSSPPTRVTSSTPPTSPESAGSSSERNLRTRMVRSVSPPPLPGKPSSGREPRKPLRRRLQGVIPAGPTVDRVVDRGDMHVRSKHQGKVDEHSSSNSSGSRTEHHSNRMRSKSAPKRAPRSPVSILKNLDHLRV